MFARWGCVPFASAKLGRVFGLCKDLSVFFEIFFVWEGSKGENQGVGEVKNAAELRRKQASRENLLRVVTLAMVSGLGALAMRLGAV